MGLLFTACDLLPVLARSFDTNDHAKTKRPAPRLLATVKDRLQSGDGSGAFAFLNAMASRVNVQAFREQKVLLAAKDPNLRRAIAERYLRKAESIVPFSEHSALANYVQFSLFVGEQFEQIGRKATQERAKLTRLSRSTLMNVCATVADTMARQYYDTAWKDYPEEATPQQQASSTAARLHGVNARLLDMSFAVTRAVTFTAPVTSTRRAERPQTLDKRELAAIHQLITIASHWNTFEYLWDQVSFGEWVVTSFQREPDEVTMDPADRLLWRSKRHAIRHRLVRHNLIRRRRSWIEATHGEVIDAGISYAAEYFRSREHSNHIGIADIESKVRKDLILTSLAIEDELLLVADSSRQQIAAHYTVALLLRCFEATSKALNESIPNSDFIRYTWFDRAAVEYVLSALSIPEEITSGALAAQVRPIPRRHWDLLQQPFVLVSNNVIGVIGFGGDWPASLRLLVERAGTLADRYGALWESHVERKLTQEGWASLGRNVALKEGGRVLTDIDLLMARDDTLYVLQVKGVSNGGRNPFEQWKTRLAIEEGVAQAVTAMAWLRNHAHELRALRGVRYTAIQPIVITNAEIFSGWRLHDIPVIHLAEIISWFRGASIRYQNTLGKTAEVHRHIAGTEPTSEEIRSLLATPLPWRGDPGVDDATHLVERVRSVTFRVPP